MTLRSIYCLSFAALLLSCASARADEKKARTSKVGPMVELAYAGGSKVLHQLSIWMGPYQQYIQFKSLDKKSYKMDCRATKTLDSWQCDIPCDGGHLQIQFSPDSKFQNIVILPFEIRLRVCDGNESAADPVVKTKANLKFQLLP